MAISAFKTFFFRKVLFILVLLCVIFLVRLRGSVDPVILDLATVRTFYDAEGSTATRKVVTAQQQNNNNKREVTTDGATTSTHSFTDTSSQATDTTTTTKLSTATIKMSVTSSQCSPQNNILFLKTHKTGSSTMINMLQRYGDKHNLTFVLPYKDNLLGWPNSFQPRFALPAPKTGYNILCNHARYNRTSMREILPKDTVFVTILREPVQQFESAFKYMNMASYLRLKNMTDPLRYFVSHPDPFKILKKAMNSQATYLAWNGMSYDLGLMLKDFRNEKKILENIYSLEKDFDVVIMAEYFEESLILLKQRLCWRMEDVVYFTMNQRPDKLKRKILDPTFAKDILKWNKADAMLYDHFNKSFWRKIKEQGPSFHEEVKLLKIKNQEMRDICLEGKYVRDKSVGWFEVKGFTLRASALKNPLCTRLVTSELAYTDILRRKHKKMIRWVEPTTSRPPKKSKRSAVKS